MVRCSRGFTLVEMMIVVLLMGLMLAFAVPALRRLGNTQNLKGAKEDVIAQLQMARARAISTGLVQRMHFYPGTYGYDYHLHPATSPPSADQGWMFPKGVSYETNASVSIEMNPDGTASFPLGPNTIALKNQQGVRDTVAVMASGLVVSQ